MEEDFNPNFFDADSPNELISRYENMIRNEGTEYFDVEDFERILEYYMDLNQMGKAMKAVRYAFKLHPDAVSLQIKKAQILLKNNNPKRALGVLDKLQRIESQNSELLVTKGHANVLLGNIEDAKEQYDRAIQQVHDKDELVDLLYNISQTFQFEDHYKLATEYLKKAYLLTDDYMFILYDLAYCYEKTGDIDKSIYYYNQYLEKDPFSDNVWFTLGRLYEEKANNDKALEAYGYVNALNPKFPEALLAIGQIYEDNFQYELAINYFKEYLELESDSFEVHYFIGSCYNLLDDWDNALDYYRKSLKIEPYNADVFHGMASVYYKKAEFEDALFYSKRSVLIDDKNPKFFVLNGKIYSKLDMSEEAIESFLQTTEIKPQLAYYWLLLADELIRDKQYRKGIEKLNESLEFHDNSPAILVRLAALYFKEKNKKQALLNLSEAINLDRNAQNEFIKICPEAENQKEFNKMLNNQTIKK